ncbi:MAG TPA: TetR/AcrR family transcriptional regulator [Candidatus Micrarchaeia archaeon]|nr:TetR/AcrR family transcriptional regulator [Candidatus Micrarchaeia archaeon]
MVRAARLTLEREGFAGTTARAIARTGHLNQALIFYHFGSVHALLLAALDESSERRLARYREQLAGVDSPTGLVRVMRSLYGEDLAEGHVAVVQALAAGGSSSTELGRALAARMEPWVDFATEVLSRLVGATPLAPWLPVPDLAFAIVACYFGMETVAHLDGDRSRAASLFETAARLAPLADQLLGRGAGPGPAATGAAP